jgi:hypothetical protein
MMLTIVGLAATEPGPSSQLLLLGWDRSSWQITFSVHWIVGVAALCIILIAIAWKWFSKGYSLKHFEIDQAEIGIGNSKFSFRPNLTDRQVAYAIWVELSTRKIGLPIDLRHDVIVEIYDSWYNFFSVTRDLIKSIPVAQVKRSGTQAIVKLSIEVLNEGLRPHLTEWQARFRAWYDRELKRYATAEGKTILDPQQIQEQFPRFKDLQDDLHRVNNALIRYRSKMRELIMRD